MIQRQHTIRSSRLVAPITAIMVLACGAFGHAQASESDAARADADKSSRTKALTNARIDAHQGELLDVAFHAVSAMPVDPHIKDRSRAQQRVVTTCLKLDQPKRALQYAEQIENWRRGAALADIALYAAQNDATANVQQYLDRAARMAANRDLEQWRRDRIRAKIAMVYTWLEQSEKAAQFQRDLGKSEQGKVDSIKAMRADENTFNAQLQAIAAPLASGDFELVKNASQAGVRLFDRFYHDAERRAKVEQTITSAWSPLPIMLRLQLTLQMARAALDHDDKSKALELINEAQSLLDNHRWTAENRVPLMARVAKLRFLAGEPERALRDLKAAEQLFHDERRTIINMFRAEALCPVAEAYHAMGETSQALQVYAQALKEAVVNPNSRPRGEDLAEVCTSMAEHDVTPTADLQARIRQTFEALGRPW